MIFIFAGKEYKNYRIPQAELPRLQFVLSYAFFPIMGNTGTKLHEYVVSGLAIEPPKGEGKDYHLQPMLTRVLESTDANLSIAPDVNRIRCDSKISRYYPAFNWLERTTGLEAKDLRRNVLADMRDFQFFGSMGGALRNAMQSLFTLSLQVQHFKSNAELVQFLLVDLQKKTGWEPQRTLDFYNAIKAAKLLSTANGAPTAFQKHQLGVFARRGEIEGTAWDDTLKTLDAYAELVGNKDYMQNPRWQELMLKLKNYGIEVG